jgi:uncharacterized protein (TIGR03435 family)
MRYAALALLTLSFAGPMMHAQSKPAGTANLAFDVVSIKPHKVVERGGRIGFEPGGRFVMVNLTVAGLVLSAYPTKTGEFAGAPDWVSSDRFDVDARAGFEPTRDQQQVLLRNLLADRFTFAAHYESQEKPVYNLVLTRADGRLGPRIRRIDVDCATYKPDPNAPSAATSASDLPPCSYRMSGGARTLMIVSGGRTLQALGDSMQSFAGRPIVDKTGLNGYFAFTFEMPGPDEPGALYTALQEQLGLKLEPARAPIDVLIVDHIQRPTEN